MICGGIISDPQEIWHKKLKERKQISSEMMKTLPVIRLARLQHHLVHIVIPSSLISRHKCSCLSRTFHVITVMYFR
jgi:hypothetical protein